MSGFNLSQAPITDALNFMRQVPSKSYIVQTHAVGVTNQIMCFLNLISLVAIEYASTFLRSIASTKHGICCVCTLRYIEGTSRYVKQLHK